MSQRTRNSRTGGNSLPARRLEVGAEWRDNDLPRLETRVGLPSIPMGHGLQRSAIFFTCWRSGSPTFPIDPEGYHEWTSTFEWKKFYDIEHFYAGPLFIHQMSQLWLDFRGIHDDFNRKTGIDYFENSRRATYVQRQYGIENPHGVRPLSRVRLGIHRERRTGPRCARSERCPKRVFYDYMARGAPFGPDDGTISPWAVVASLPFAPEIVIDTVRHAIERLDLKRPQPLRIRRQFQSHLSGKKQKSEWLGVSVDFRFESRPDYSDDRKSPVGADLEDGPQMPFIVEGLRRAGFRGGWLDEAAR